MNVLVRTKREHKRALRRRESTGATPASHQTPASEPAPAQSVSTHPATTSAVSVQHRFDPEAIAPHRRHLHGPMQDNALYHCGCGYVFEAEVSTTVDCPNCGGGQAW